MSAEAATRVLVVAVGQCAAETMVWRMRGELRVSVIVKGTFALQPDAPMRRVAPDPIVTTEVHHGKNPSRSVRLTTDLLPYLPAADVVLTGHACAPEGETALGMSVRLAVYRENALLDKSINVLPSTEDDCEVPFETMPLVYEKAYGGVGFADNPFGAGATGPQDRSPNLTDPNEPTRVACFAPIARGWPNRKRLLGKVDRKTLEAAVCEIPDGFNFAYFQAAPADQQIPYLQGNEWIVLEGMHATHPQLCSCLPSAIGRARVYGMGGPGQGRALALVADSLRIDADSLTCSVTWRGSFAVGDAATLERICIHTGIDTADSAVDWPPPPSARAPAPVAARPIAAEPAVHAAPTASAPPAAPSVPAAPSGQAPGVMTQPSPVAPAAASPSPLEDTSSMASTLVTVGEPSRPERRPPTPSAPIHVDGSKTAPSPNATPPPAQAARARKVWDSTVELEDAEPLRPSSAVPFRKGPVNLPPSPAPSPRKADFSATMVTTDLFDKPDKAPATLPFQRQHGAAVVARPAHNVPPAAPSTRDSPPPAPVAHNAHPSAQPARDLPPPAPVVRDLPPPAARDLPPPAARAPLSPDIPVPVMPAARDLPAAPAADAIAPPRKPEGPARPKTPEGIEIVNETPLVLGTVRWDNNPSRCAITVFAKATCDLVPDGPAAVRAKAEDPSRDRTEPGPRGQNRVYPSDLVPFKVRADVTLLGHAHAPPGGATEMEVRFKFGEDGEGFDRKLLVLGDRTWVKSGAFYKPSPPERFLQIRLLRERAFGGKGYEKNPQGLGFFSGTPKAPVPMPNLEDPNSRVRTPKQTPEPASFAPLPLDHGDPEGANGAARSLPERFDWTRHQAAPPEQRLAFLRGDEPFEIAGIHPKVPVLKGTLPGLAVRCFAERPRGQEEVPMRLDTAFFDLDEKTLTLVWRGVIPVSDERSPDVRSLRLVTAPIGDDDAPATA